MRLSISWFGFRRTLAGVGVASYGDDPNDQSWIQRDIWYYQQGNCYKRPCDQRDDYFSGVLNRLCGMCSAI